MGEFAPQFHDNAYYNQQNRGFFNSIFSENLTNENSRYSTLYLSLGRHAMLLE